MREMDSSDLDAGKQKEGGWPSSVVVEVRTGEPGMIQSKRYWSIRQYVDWRSWVKGHIRQVHAHDA